MALALHRILLASVPYAITVVLVGCFETPQDSFGASAERSTQAASVAPTSVPSPTPTATVEPTASTENAESLPPFVQILSPEYHAAYRLLPDGPWARESISQQFQNFDLGKWRQLDWEEGFEAVFKYELDAWKKVRWKRVLQDSEDDPDVEEWLVERVRGTDPEISQQFEVVGSVSERMEVVRRLIEVEGLYVDVEGVLVEWEGRQVGHSDELIAITIEDIRDMHEVSQVW